MTREGLRKEIERVYQASWMRRYWGTIGRGLARLTGRKGEAPVWVSTLREIASRFALAMTFEKGIMM